MEADAVTARIKMRRFTVLFLGCFVGSVLSAGGSGMLNDMDMMKKDSVRSKTVFEYYDCNIIQVSFIRLTYMLV